MIQFDEHIFQMGWFNHQLGLRGPPPNANPPGNKALLYIQEDITLPEN